MLARLKIPPRDKSWPPYWQEGYLLWLRVGSEEKLFALVVVGEAVKLTHYASGLAFTGEDLGQARVCPQQLVDEVVALKGEDKVIKVMEAAKVINDEQNAFQRY